MKTLDELKLKKLIKTALDIAPELTPQQMWIAVQTKGDWNMKEVNKVMDEVAQMHTTDPHIVVGPQQQTLEEVIENAERKKKEREESECGKK